MLAEFSRISFHTPILFPLLLAILYSLDITLDWPHNSFSDWGQHSKQDVGGDQSLALMVNKYRTSKYKTMD